MVSRHVYMSHSETLENSLFIECFTLKCRYVLYISDMECFIPWISNENAYMQSFYLDDFVRFFFVWRWMDRWYVVAVIACTKWLKKKKNCWAPNNVVDGNTICQCQAFSLFLNLFWCLHWQTHKSSAYLKFAVCTILLSLPSSSSLAHRICVLTNFPDEYENERKCIRYLQASIIIIVGDDKTNFSTFKIKICRFRTHMTFEYCIYCNWQWIYDRMWCVICGNCAQRQIEFCNDVEDDDAMMLSSVALCRTIRI